MSEALGTLLHPIQTGVIELPAGARVLVLNAPVGFRLPSDLRAIPSLVQDFRPDFLALQRAGHVVTPNVDGDGYDLALVLCGRHRGRNELWVAEALRRTRPGALVVVGGAKTDGAASLKKRIGALSNLEGNASKHHGVVFWLRRPDDVEQLASALVEANPPLLLDDGYATVPGLFSHDRIDAGSRLLAETLPADLRGRAADFGAGWGYLSARLAQTAHGIESVDLYEAGFAACEAARSNLARLAPDTPVEVHWHDILSEAVPRRYDVIVMNPPFHGGRAAEPAMGEGFIRAASAALKPGGRLWLVANRPLPYEVALQRHFPRYAETLRDERYKVLCAIR